MTYILVQMILSVLADKEGMGRDRHLKLKATEMGYHRMKRGANRKMYFHTFPEVSI